MIFHGDDSIAVLTLCNEPPGPIEYRCLIKPFTFPLVAQHTQPHIIPRLYVVIARYDVVSQVSMRWPLAFLKQPTRKVNLNRFLGNRRQIVKVSSRYYLLCTYLVDVRVTRAFNENDKLKMNRPNRKRLHIELIHFHNVFRSHNLRMDHDSHSEQNCLAVSNIMCLNSQPTDAGRKPRIDYDILQSSAVKPQTK